MKYWESSYKLGREALISFPLQFIVTPCPLLISISCLERFQFYFLCPKHGLYVASLNPGCPHLISYSQDLTEVAKTEFDVVPRYVEFRTILDGQPTSSRASESGWKALREDLEKSSGGGSRKPVLRITIWAASKRIVVTWLKNLSIWQEKHERHVWASRAHKHGDTMKLLIHLSTRNRVEIHNSPTFLRQCYLFIASSDISNTGYQSEPNWTLSGSRMEREISTNATSTSC